MYVFAAHIYIVPRDLILMKNKWDLHTCIYLLLQFINTYSDLYALDEASRKIILLSKLSSETHNKLESPDSESAEHSEASTSTQETLTMNG